MTHRNTRDAHNARRDARAWLAAQARWEDRLAELRRPGGGRRAPARRPRPDADLRHAS